MNQLQVIFNNNHSDEDLVPRFFDQRHFHCNFENFQIVSCPLSALSYFIIKTIIILITPITFRRWGSVSTSPRLERAPALPGSWTIEASTMRRLLGKTIIFWWSYSIEKHSTSPSDRFVFAATSNCEVIHGTIYSCLRAMFGLSVVGILVSIFSCMLVYQVVKTMVLLTLTLLMVVTLT